MRIEAIEVGTFRVPLAAPWGDQTHQIDFIDLVITEILADTGTTGTGFSYTVGVGSKAIESLLRWDIVPRLIGVHVAPRLVAQKLWTDLHDAGGAGLLPMAIAAVDLALWDMVSKEQGLPLVDFLGRVRDDIPAYGSGVNLNLSLDQLLGQVEGWLAAGYQDVKIKVGKPDLHEDMDRVSAVREIIGPRRRLMVDANQGWDLPAALRAISQLARFDIYWVEEPLIADDVRGHAALRSAVDVPIAVGENIYNRYQFSEYLSSGAVDFVQADVVRVGGVSSWLEIANLAALHGRPMAPHYMLEISGQLLCAIPNAEILEDVAAGSLRELGVLAEDIGTQAGRFRPTDRPGHGIRFDSAVLEVHRLHDDLRAAR